MARKKVQEQQPQLPENEMQLVVDIKLPIAAVNALSQILRQTPLPLDTSLPILQAIAQQVDPQVSVYRQAMQARSQLQPPADVLQEKAPPANDPPPLVPMNRAQRRQSKSR